MRGWRKFWRDRLGKSLKFAADREKTTKEVSYVKSMYSVQLHLGINEGQVF